MVMQISTLSRLTETNPFGGNTLNDGSLRLYRAPPSNQLHQQNPKGVDITLLIELVCSEVFWIKIACCSFDLSRDMASVSWSQFGKPKVSNLGSKIVH